MWQHFSINKNSSLNTISKVPTTKEITLEVKASSGETPTLHHKTKDQMHQEMVNSVSTAKF
jgi:hypothetical protein